MERLRRGTAAAGPRTYFLAGLLVLTLVWAGSQGGRRGRRPATLASPAASAAIPAIRAEDGDIAAPSGWGADPFAPKALGTRSSKGGETE